ncbi:uncharacterized protein At4g04775-like [Arachis ipaensis]|uniref:GRF-type domain-containing protein n=1 Tax=Arachis hypogaea TaxID=3818 RepID=A0A444YJ08_ARAHY|nr:uncharacterized protein At4g04775-like [Arachis ipaensis]XP_025661120.1 uncharacterized protein At4g04775-like [Arachis hypogaea]RYR01940.1 hypothetical protein Ahy_B06g080801 [Arachis hypogaea]
MASGGNTSVASRRRGWRTIDDVFRVDSGSTGFLRGQLRRGEHPKCKCNTYAVISRSRTTENPNRLFFGCPHFKEKQGYCNFFVWFDEIFGCLVDDVVESSRLASMETCKGEEFGAGLNYTLEERVKQLEEMLIKRNEDSSKIKKDSVFRLFSSVIMGALVVVILFCIYVVVI